MGIPNYWTRWWAKEMMMTDGISQGIADEGARADRAALKLLKENNAQLRADNERLRGVIEELRDLAEEVYLRKSKEDILSGVLTLKGLASLALDQARAALGE